MFLPVKMIKTAEDNGWSRSLAYFIKLKSLHKTNTHYNYSLRSLSKMIDCSPACLSFHLKELNKQGVVSYTANNITFSGLKKLQTTYGSKNVGVPVNHQYQLDILRGQIIRFNLSAQAYNIKKSEPQISQPALRRKNYYAPAKQGKTKDSYTGLSTTGTGNLFGMSMATGSRLLSRLESLKIMWKKPKFRLLYYNRDKREYELLKREGIIPQYSCYIGTNILIRTFPELKYVGWLSSLQKLNK